MSEPRSPLRPVSAILIMVVSILGALAPAPDVRAQDATLINTILTSRWSKPSPDPSGITYWPKYDHLVLVDGEVEEMAIWAGANVFESTRAGSLVTTYDTSSWNDEPVGIDIDIAENGHWFISNDSKKTIFDIDLGPDGEFGTSDDRRRPFLTSGFGNGDPEGLSLGDGKLYTVDGAGRQVYVTEDGGNGIFEASDPTTWFDVGRLGVRDPEGIDYDPRTGNLWLVDRGGQRLNEITTGGRLLQSVDLKALVDADFPGDVTLAPGSDNPAEQHLYVVDRGIDNNTDPNENDGRIYELALGSSAPSIAYELSPESPDGSNGWYRSDVTLKWIVTDPESPSSVVLTGCDEQAITSDQNATDYTCQASSDGGSASETVTIKRDATKPALAPRVTPMRVLQHGTATASPNATDGGSGLARAGCGRVATGFIGLKTVTCVAVDNAGNLNSASASYRVIYHFSGFAVPVDNVPTLNILQSGAAVPVRFSLNGYRGMEVLATGYPRSIRITCPTGVPRDIIEETVPATSNSFNYSRATGQYTFTWKTSNTWAAGTCRQFTVKLIDGTVHRANFKFR